MDYWLPEFKPPPPNSRGGISEAIEGCGRKFRDQWLQKTLEVRTRDVKTSDFIWTVKSMEPAIIPPCQCPVCRLINTTKVSGPGVVGVMLKDIAFVEHSPQKYTLYDRTRPWQRQYVANCTNPQPLTRRMPPITASCSELANKVYYTKMMYPGRIVKDPMNY